MTAQPRPAPAPPLRLVPQPKAAIYCRVSTRDQELEGTSLESQEASCRRHAADLGYAIDERHVYRETFSGAELWDRPKLNQLRAAVRARGIDALIVHATDRLARDPIHLAIVAGDCERFRVALAFVTEPLDASDEGALIRYVKGYAAKIEREKIKERTLRGKRASAAAGRLNPTHADMYGYRFDPATRGRQVDETQAAVVRLIFHWYAEERVSLRGIATRLNAAGVPSPATGKRQPKADRAASRWCIQIVQRILRDPTYKGDAYAFRYTTDAQGRQVLRPEAEWIRLPAGTSPALVSPELWQAAQDRRAANRGADTRNHTRPYLLRGIVHCAVCGRRMYADPHRKRAGGPVERTYRCPSRLLPEGACGAGRVPADAIEAWAWGELEAAIDDPSRIAEQREQARRDGPDPALTGDLETARRELRRREVQQERLARRLREADDTLWDLIERELRTLEGEKRQYAAMIADIEARLAEQRAAIDQLDALDAYCRRVRGNLDRLDFAGRRLAFAAFDVRIAASGPDRDSWRLRGSAPVLTPGGEATHGSRGAGRRPWS